MGAEELVIPFWNTIGDSSLLSSAERSNWSCELQLVLVVGGICSTKRETLSSASPLQPTLDGSPEHAVKYKGSSRQTIAGNVVDCEDFESLVTGETEKFISEVDWAVILRKEGTDTVLVWEDLEKKLHMM